LYLRNIGLWDMLVADGAITGGFFACLFEIN
jgi:hypothetical protein